MCSTSPPSRMHGVGFWASRRSGPKTLTYSPSTGSSRRSAGTSGNWARNSSTVIGVPADRAHAARSGEWRICMMAPFLLDEGQAARADLGAIADSARAVEEGVDPIGVRSVRAQPVAGVLRIAHHAPGVDAGLAHVIHRVAQRRLAVGAIADHQG